MKKIKKLILLMTGSLILLSFCACTGLEEGKKDLPETPAGESTHNETSGLNQEMPEHEDATTDPDFFEKNSDMDKADEVRKNTDSGYNRVTDEFDEKNDEAEKKMHQTESDYNKAKDSAAYDIDGIYEEGEEELNRRKKGGE